MSHEFDAARNHEPNSGPWLNRRVEGQAVATHDVPKRASAAEPPPASPGSDTAANATTPNDGPDSARRGVERQAGAMKTAPKRAMVTAPPPASIIAGIIPLPTAARLIAQICVEYRRREYLRVSIGAQRSRLQRFVATDRFSNTNEPNARALAAARRLIAAIIGGQPDPLAPFILATEEGLRPFDKLLAGTEKTLRKLTVQHPVWRAWGEAVRGFGPLSLAIIIGEAGDLAGYRTHSAFWHRMCVGLVDGEIQRKRRGISQEEAMRVGYDEERRAASWRVFDSLFRAQWRGARDADGKKPEESGKPVAVPAHALGRYGEVYARRKAYELARNDELQLTAFHIERRARRYTEKRLLRDLWLAWRRAAQHTPPIVARDATPGAKFAEAAE